MKREYTKLFFKVKYNCGIYNRGVFFTFEGKSRIDGRPIYSCKAEIGLGSDWRFPYGDLIFQGRPEYTPTVDDFELITNTLEDHISPKGAKLVSPELIEVKPLGPPSGILYYVDYVYDQFDERLILML